MIQGPRTRHERSPQEEGEEPLAREGGQGGTIPEMKPSPQHGTVDSKGWITISSSRKAQGRDYLRTYGAPCPGCKKEAGRKEEEELH